MQNIGDLALVPDHDAYYFVDTSVVFSYHRNDVPGLKKYVDFLSLKGKRFFVTERIHREITSITLPNPFHVYNNPEASALANRAYPTLMREFACKSPKFERDTKWLLEAGFCLASCEDIPPEIVANDGRVFAMTGNAAFIRKFLGTPQGRAKFETVVDNFSLEHLANIRKLNMATGCFEDVFTFPTLAT